MNIDTAANIVYGDKITHELFDGVSLIRSKNSTRQGYFYKWTVLADSDKLVYSDKDILNRIIDIIGTDGVFMELGAWRPVDYRAEKMECRLFETQELKRV